jgi:septum formation protein
VQKALSAAKKIWRGGEFPDILAADTAVVLDGALYGKPMDAEEAAAFLRDFSGRTHAVYSAVALIAGNRESADGTDSLPFPTVRSRKAEVTFKTLDDGEIAGYVSTGEWKGAAGGYRIQGRGACFIEHVSEVPGCVAGLPILDVYELLRALPESSPFA